MPQQREPRSFTHDGKIFYGFKEPEIECRHVAKYEDLDAFSNLHAARTLWLRDRQYEMDQQKCLSPGLRDAIEECLKRGDILIAQINMKQRCYSGIEKLPNWEQVPELTGLGLCEQERARNIWIQEVKVLIEQYQRWISQLNDVYFDTLEAYAKMVSPSQK